MKDYRDESADGCYCCSSSSSQSNTSQDDELTATEDRDPEIIALVQEPGLGSSLKLLQAQANDKVLQEVKIALQQGTALPRQFQGMCGKLVIKEEVLYHRQADTSILQAVMPHSLQRTVLEQIHNNFGVHKTLEKLRECFYWPGNQADVKNGLGSASHASTVTAHLKSLKLYLEQSLQSTPSRNSHGTLWAHCPHRPRDTATI